MYSYERVPINSFGQRSDKVRSGSRPTSSSHFSLLTESRIAYSLYEYLFPAVLLSALPATRYPTTVTGQSATQLTS